jgi:hypothetical protein
MNDYAAVRPSPLGLFPGQPTPRLYNCVVEALRTRHYSRQTEEACLHWIRRFLVFHNGTNPRAMAEMEMPDAFWRKAVTNPTRVKRGNFYVPNR